MTESERQQDLNTTETVDAAAASAGAVAGLPPNAPQAAGGETRSQWRDIWRQFSSHRGAMVALVLFVLPSLVIAHFHYAGAALVLAAMILLLSLSAFALPGRSDFAVDQAKDSSLQGRFRFPVSVCWALGFSSSCVGPSFNIAGFLTCAA